MTENQFHIISFTMVNYWFSDQNTVIQKVITIAKDPYNDIFKR